MPINADPHFVGRAWITPDGPVVAGQYGTWTITGIRVTQEDGAQAWTSPVYLEA
jgi:hypothetical protein